MSTYVVTGASRGIGSALVQQLSTNPSNTIFALVRTKTNFIYTPASNVHVFEIGEIGGTEAYTSKLEQVVKDVERISGKVDVLINNAAVLHGQSPKSYAEGEGLKKFLQEMNENWEVNVVGVNVTIYAFIPLLKKSPDPKAVTVSSALGDMEFTRIPRFAGTAPYSISKAAVTMLTAKWAFDYPEIKFLSLCPGYVDTLTRERKISPGMPKWRLTLAIGLGTAEEEQRVQYLTAQFQKIKPIFQGPITMKESARACLHVIDHLTEGQSGELLSHNGSKDFL
ncbi:NAD(P)-binding protein [Atractiella rhizophila]|nr:NAD(P)-binding protein [Atractiella rhizophila]